MKKDFAPVDLRVETGVEFSICGAASGGTDWADRVRMALAALPEAARKLVMYLREPVLRLSPVGDTLTLAVRQYTLTLDGPGALVPEVNIILDTFVRGAPNGQLMLAAHYPGPFRRAAAEGRLKHPKLVLTVCPQGPLPAWLETDLERLALAMREDQGEDRFQLRRHELPPQGEIFALLSNTPKTAAANGAG